MKQGLAMVSQCISFTRLSSVWVWRSPEIYMSQVSIVLDQSAEASNSAHQASGCHCDLDEGHGNWWKEFKRCVGFECMVLQRSSLSMYADVIWIWCMQKRWALDWCPMTCFRPVLPTQAVYINNCQWGLHGPIEAISKLVPEDQTTTNVFDCFCA